MAAQAARSDPAAILRVDRKDIDAVAQQFTDEERITVGLGEQGVPKSQPVLVELMAGSLHHGQHLGAVEAPEHDTGPSRFSVHGAEQLGQRACARHVGLPEGTHYQ